MTASADTVVAFLLPSTSKPPSTAIELSSGLLKLSRLIYKLGEVNVRRVRNPDSDWGLLREGRILPRVVIGEFRAVEKHNGDEWTQESIRVGRGR